MRWLLVAASQARPAPGSAGPDQGPPAGECAADGPDVCLLQLRGAEPAWLAPQGPARPGARRQLEAGWVEPAEAQRLQSLCGRPGEAHRGAEVALLEEALPPPGPDPLLFDPQSRLLMCALPKNACTELKQLFFRAAGLEPEAWDPTRFGHRQECVHWEPRDQFFRASGPVRLPPKGEESRERTEKELAALFGDRTFRAVVVRDPVERFRSAFGSKIGHECSYVCRDLGVSANRSVDAVLDALERQPAAQRDAHFRPQALMCGLQDGLQRFDFVGRLGPGWPPLQEQLELLAADYAAKLGADLLPLLTGYGLQRGPLFPPERAAGALAMPARERVALSPEQTQRVRRLYEADYAAGIWPPA